MPIALLAVLSLLHQLPGGGEVDQVVEVVLQRGVLAREGQGAQANSHFELFLKHVARGAKGAPVIPRDDAGSISEGACSLPVLTFTMKLMQSFSVRGNRSIFSDAS